MTRINTTALALSLATLTAPLHAANETPFSRAALVAAQAKGEPILVDVAASWCPTCMSQHRTVTRLIANKQFDRLHIFKLDYDKQKPEWQALGTHKQGTLIGYKGKHEVGRIEFQTDETQIRQLLITTVK